MLSKTHAYGFVVVLTLTSLLSCGGKGDARPPQKEVTGSGVPIPPTSGPAELEGIWLTQCEGFSLRSAQFTGNVLHYVRRRYANANCTNIISETNWYSEWTVRADSSMPPYNRVISYLNGDGAGTSERLTYDPTAVPKYIMFEETGAGIPFLKY